MSAGLRAKENSWDGLAVAMTCRLAEAGAVWRRRRFGIPEVVGPRAEGCPDENFGTSFYRPGSVISQASVAVGLRPPGAHLRSATKERGHSCPLHSDCQRLHFLGTPPPGENAKILSPPKNLARCLLYQSQVNSPVGEGFCEHRLGGKVLVTGIPTGLFVLF